MDDLRFEEVDFNMIGSGGIAGDRTLVKQVNEAIQRLAQMVHEPGRDGTASIAIKVTIKAEGEHGVVLSPSLKESEPARSIRALSAQVTRDGQILTVQHKQQSLPGVTPIKRGEEA